MKKIILDTNFCTIPFQFKLDIFSEIERIVHEKYQVCILDKTLDELKNIIEKQRGKNKVNAKLALQLLKHKKVKIIKTKDEKYVDKLILDMVDKDYIVCTQDKELKKKLKKKGIKVIIMRQKKYLVMI